MIKKSKIIKNLFLSLFIFSTVSCVDNPLTPDSSAIVNPEPVVSINADKLPHPDHIVIVVLENHAYTQIINSSSAPYINSLSNTGALFTQSYGITHPSQPNYLLLFSGSAQGVTNDSYPQNFPYSTPNLGSSLLSGGFSFAGYSEDLPSVGFTGAKNKEYASKHSPWVYWQGNGPNGIPAEANQPFTSFPKDFSKLPNLSFVIPNMDHDMHNGIFSSIIKTGDTWVKDNLDSYVQWAKTNNSLLILTFDEDNDLHKNRITTIFHGPMVKTGIYDEEINHFSVLRTLEDIYQIPYAGSSANVAPITDCWKSSN